MNSLVTTHPSREVLKAFGLGKLDPVSADSIALHLESCDGCRGMVAELSGDSFLGRLRELNFWPMAVMILVFKGDGNALSNQMDGMKYEP